MEIAKLGRYEITGTLGQGAMGVVYKARDPLLDRDVAIKTINVALEEEEIAEYGARFEQEARAAGGLNHPNVITIYDVGSSGNVAYMAMEYLEGRELRYLVGDGKPLPVAQALDIATQVADGLAYAHEHDVVHRDIKPANIMIVRGGRAKITDFGIARMRTSQVKTQTGMVLGSPKYMSPEQVMGLRADGRSDIFSLGVVLYEMLTGAAPFKGDSITALMFQVLNGIPTPPRQLVPLTPEMLNFVMAKALAKKPDERYQSASDFANDLRECAKQLSTEQPASTAAPGPPVDDAKTELVDMFKTMVRSRLGDATEIADETPTTGVSRKFDSYEATLKVASQTGMAEELEDYAKTQKIVSNPAPEEPAAARSGRHETVGAATATPPAATARNMTLAEKLALHEDWVLGAGIVVAVLVAALIVFF
jgi:serine/threonine-protein kinase